MPSTITPEATPRQLQIGGFVPFSTTDFPGKLSAVVFVQGCPWRCAYCHNPHLQPRLDASPLSWEDVLTKLRRRSGLIDAVVFSGGEPTLDPALEDTIREVRALGFQVGLHTAGIYPRRLAEILPHIDWVGFDVKAPFADYEKITGIQDSGEQVLTCVEMLLTSGVAYEFRTTIHPDLISEEELIDLAESLAEMGVKNYALQLFRKEGCDSDALAVVGSDFPPKEMVKKIAGMFQRFTWRDS